MRFLKNFLVSLFALLLMLMLVEAVLQIQKYFSGSTIRSENGLDPVKTGDSLFFKDYIPYAKFYRDPTKGDEFTRVYNTYNSIGIRGEEIPDKKPGEKRILLIGDSFIEAEEIELSATVGEQLDSLLPENYKVIQHGVSSWAPLLYLNWILKKGLTLDIDEVIIFLFPNDFYSIEANQGSDSDYTQYCVFDSKGLPEYFDFNRPIKEITKSLIERSALYKLLVNAAINQLSQQELNELLEENSNEFQKRYASYNHGLLSEIIKDDVKLARDTSLWDSELRDRVQLTLNYLEKTKEVLSKNGVKLSIARIPSGWNFSDETKLGRWHYGFKNCVLPMGGLDQKIEAFCIQNGIPFINLFQELAERKKQTGKLFYLQSDGHWNTNGHRAVAEILYQEIISKNFNSDSSDIRQF